MEMTKNFESKLKGNSRKAVFGLGVVSIVSLATFLYMVFIMNAPSNNHLTLLSMIPFAVFQITGWAAGHTYYKFQYLPDTDWDEYGL